MLANFNKSLKKIPKKKEWRDKVLLAAFKTTLATARNSADTMKIEICETGKKTKKELADGKHKTN